MSRYLRLPLLITAALAALLLVACEDCETSKDCPTGQACINGSCSGGDGIDFGSDGDTDTDGDGDTDGDSDGDTDSPGAIVWVEIEGGSYLMGSDQGGSHTMPIHNVDVPTFEITRTEITTLQYSACVITDECAEPETGYQFNWDEPGRFNYPVNGVDWTNAMIFCSSVGGRLPSEAEWEYAARNGDLQETYPWGEEDASCELAIIREDEQAGCGQWNTWAVCSTPAGNTVDDLCDMAGNVWEWMADYYYDDYLYTPTDGSAAIEPPYEGASNRVIKGGGFLTTFGSGKLRGFERDPYSENASQPDLGFRCARDVDGDDPDGGVDAGT